MKKFDLNISTARTGWNAAAAIKEFIADALEEQAATSSDEVQIYSDDAGVWHIRDFGRGIKYTHLTRDYSSENMSYLYKAAASGENLDDAIGTLHHYGVEVTIDSRWSRITFIRTDKHGFEGVNTILALVDAPVDPSMIGTDVQLKGVEAKDIEDAKNMFLKYRDQEPLEVTKYGEVYPRSESYGEIFVNGIKVSQEPFFLFSYNLTSASAFVAKSLSMERSGAGKNALRERIKSILTNCTSDIVIDTLTANLDAYSDGTMSDELRWPRVASYSAIKLHSRRNVLFLTPRQLEKNIGRVGQLAWQLGKDLVFVNALVLARIEGKKDDAGNVISTLNSLK